MDKKTATLLGLLFAYGCSQAPQTTLPERKHNFQKKPNVAANFNDSITTHVRKPFLDGLLDLEYDANNATAEDAWLYKYGTWIEVGVNASGWIAHRDSISGELQAMSFVNNDMPLMDKYVNDNYTIAHVHTHPINDNPAINELKSKNANEEIYRKHMNILISTALASFGDINLLVEKEGRDNHNHHNVKNIFYVRSIFGVCEMYLTEEGFKKIINTEAMTKNMFYLDKINANTVNQVTKHKTLMSENFMLLPEFNVQKSLKQLAKDMSNDLIQFNFYTTEELKEFKRNNSSPLLMQ